MTDTKTMTVVTAPDPFDLSKMRLDQSFIETSGVKKLLSTVPVGKPNPQDFIRVNPSEDYRETFAVVELKEDREFYILYREIARDLPGEYVMATLFTAINRQGVVRQREQDFGGRDLPDRTLAKRDKGKFKQPLRLCQCRWCPPLAFQFGQQFLSYQPKGNFPRLLLKFSLHRRI